MNKYPGIGDDDFRAILYSAGYTPEELALGERLMEDSPEALLEAYELEPKIPFGELEDTVCKLDLEGDRLFVDHISNVSTGIIANFYDNDGFSQAWLAHGSIYGYSTGMELSSALTGEIASFMSDKAHRGVKHFNVEGYERGILAVSGAFVRNGHPYIRKVITPKQRKRALDLDREPYYQDMKAKKPNGEVYLVSVDAQRITLEQRLVDATLFYGDKAIYKMSST